MIRSTVSAVAMPIAGKQMVGEDDVARLLAAQRNAALDHLLHHVLVADRRPHQLDAALPEGELETNVAHHRRHDRAAAQLPAALQILGRDQQDRVAVDHRAMPIDEQGAVAVAVEGNAHACARRLHRVAQRLRDASSRSGG